MAAAGEPATGAAATVRATAHALRSQAGRAGSRVERQLALRGLQPRQLGETLRGNAATARAEIASSSRRARKRLARAGARTRKELVRNARQAISEGRHVAGDAGRSTRQAAGRVAADIDSRATRARRQAQRRARKAARQRARRDHRAAGGGPLVRWPWLLGSGVVAAAVVYAAQAVSRVPVEQELPAGAEPRPGSPQSNGSVQHARDDSSSR